MAATTSHLVVQYYSRPPVSFPVGGTIAHRIGDEEEKAEHTTPEAPDIQDFARCR
jgi:UDP-N-acetylmuramyl tripeptide synthase